jgi:hypothetical protein
VVAALLVAAVVSGCTGAAGTPPAASPRSSGTVTSAAGSESTKVLVVVEENKTYSEVIGSSAAPFLNRLEATYGLATAMTAGYPVGCPSLAAYIILTSGSAQGICDDSGPDDHPLAADNVFAQVARSGRSWRAYAESMPSNCAAHNAALGRYLVRHVPPPYYLTERDRCRRWAVPMGSVGAGALHDDVAAGRLPALSFLTPNACNDMHGAFGCNNRRVARGDQWLARWMPFIFAGPDFRAGQLVVIITWDEGSDASNHIPTLVMSASTHRIRTGTPWTHCSILRTVEEILRVPLLGCASNAASMRSAFSL